MVFNPFKQTFDSSQQATPSAPDPKDYKLGIGGRILGTVNNFLAGMGGRGPVTYTGKGALKSGYYRDLAEVTHAWSVGTWQHFSATIQTNSDGTVTIKVYDDDSNPNTPILVATDAGNTNPEWTSACTTPGHYPTSHYPPLTAAGSVGVRGDFDNFNFDDFRVSSF